MAISAKDVQVLREKTGVGMMECKKALVATDGDMEKAVEYLREKGLAASIKKGDRIAAEGAAYAGSSLWQWPQCSGRAAGDGFGHRRKYQSSSLCPL